MPDYIYLLENRLSNDQRNALRQVSEAARDAGMTVFLVGGAVRDLISGSSVRDLDVTVQGNALKLKKPLLKAGATLWGEHEPSHTLFLRFPVGVTVEVSSARREEYPKPGKPVYHWANILEDLRRRDFTANAMALSLNEHSYGLLMDPLNGVADIESRQLRLVSNYGFLDEPARLLRATRLTTRLGWELEERTKVRFETAKAEGAIESLSSYQRGYELEEIGHEEDGLRILHVMESEGWMGYLDSKWTSAKADVSGLEEMHRLRTQLQLQGINPDLSATSMRLLTAKLHPKEITAIQHAFVRPGFVEEWENLDTIAKDFAKQLTGKESASPSATWKLFTSANPQAVLWLGLTSKAAPVQAKYNNFFTVWPEAKQKIPHLLMQELRITQDIPGYDEMLRQLFFDTIDGKLQTEEQLRAFLEPYSPPAPPPPVTVRRSRGSRKAGEAKVKIVDVDEEDDEIELDHDAEDLDEDGEESEEAPKLTAKPAAVKKSPQPAKPGKAEPLAKAEGSGKTEPPAAKRAVAAATPALSRAKSAQKVAAPSLATKAAVATAKQQAAAHSGKKPAPVKAKEAKTPTRTASKAPPKGKPAAKNRPSGKSAAAGKSQKKPVPAKKSSPAKKTSSTKKR